MIKKIILGLFMFSVFINIWFAGSQSERFKELQDKRNKDQSMTAQEIKDYNYYADEYWFWDEWVEALNKYENKVAEELKKNQDKAEADKAEKAANTNAHKKDCTTWENKWKCLDQPTFMIWVDETLWVWIKVDWKNTSQVINKTLGTVIQKLMIALWVLAVLIMTIWAWYIIMYHGQDELLSKGKSIFMSGITALVVALSSYYLVAILRYILYK